MESVVLRPCALLESAHKNNELPGRPVQPTAMTAGARGARPRTAETTKWLLYECERDTVFRKDRPLARPTREGQSKPVSDSWFQWAFS